MMVRSIVIIAVVLFCSLQENECLPDRKKRGELKRDERIRTTGEYMRNLRRGLLATQRALPPCQPQLLLKDTINDVLFAIHILRARNVTENVVRRLLDDYLRLLPEYADLVLSDPVAHFEQYINFTRRIYEIDSEVFVLLTQNRNMLLTRAYLPRLIVLLSQMFKTFPRIILKIFQEFGFVHELEANTLSSRLFNNPPYWTVELKNADFQRDLCLAFIDYMKAFDYDETIVRRTLVDCQSGGAKAGYNKDKTSCVDWRILLGQSDASYENESISHLEKHTGINFQDCMAPNGIKITHVIFDLDGLLLDSESVYTRINEEIMQGYGKKYTMELKTKTAGMKMDELIKTMLEHEKLTAKVTVEEYRKKYLELSCKYLPDSKLHLGALRLVKHLAKHGVPMALCTGSNAFEFETKMQKQQELLDLIKLRVLADDPAVKRGKPAPDAFLVTMGRFAVKPASAANVVVFEDSVNGVRAAVAAGMQAVMVPDLRYSRPPEDCKGKISMVLKSLEEFEPETMGLPPFD